MTETHQASVEGPAPDAPMPDMVLALEAPAPPVWRTAASVVLAWLVPGAGHVFAGQPVRGLVFGTVILAMFAAGIGLQGKLYAPDWDDPLTTLAAFAGAGVGTPYLVAHWSGAFAGDIEAPLHEYGTAFALTAGLLNLLVVLDVLDVARGRRT